MSKTILAIDDDRDMLAYYQVILADLGEVRTALNLTEARTKLTGVDIIILDFYLEQDPETIQETVPELKKVAPVLLCSGVQDIGVPVIGVESGIDGYWNKADDADKLRSLIKSKFGRNSAPKR
jgi:DNA-binding NtrC family response regulator